MSDPFCICLSIQGCECLPHVCSQSLAPRGTGRRRDSVFFLIGTAGRCSDSPLLSGGSYSGEWFEEDSMVLMICPPLSSWRPKELCQEERNNSLWASTGLWESPGETPGLEKTGEIVWQSLWGSISSWGQCAKWEAESVLLPFLWMKTHPEHQGHKACTIKIPETNGKRFIGPGNQMWSGLGGTGSVLAPLCPDAVSPYT